MHDFTSSIWVSGVPGLAVSSGVPCLRHHFDAGADAGLVGLCADEANFDPASVQRCPERIAAEQLRNGVDAIDHGVEVAVVVVVADGEATRLGRRGDSAAADAG